MAGKQRYTEFARYPTYKKAYIRAFDKMMEMRRLRGMPRGVEVEISHTIPSHSVSH